MGFNSAFKGLRVIIYKIAVIRLATIIIIIIINVVVVVVVSSATTIQHGDENVPV